MVGGGLSCLLLSVQYPMSMPFFSAQVHIYWGSLTEGQIAGFSIKRETEGRGGGGEEEYMHIKVLENFINLLQSIRFV